MTRPRRIRARTLGWTARELFGLHALPARPHPNYRRLSRYDETGLIWLLGGRPVVALTETTAAVRSASSGPHLPKTTQATSRTGRRQSR